MADNYNGLGTLEALPNNGKDPLRQFAELLARLSKRTTQFAAAVEIDLRILREKQDAQDARIAKLEQKIAEREAVEAGEHD